jgi:hypothetical protein
VQRLLRIPPRCFFINLLLSFDFLLFLTFCFLLFFFELLLCLLCELLLCSLCGFSVFFFFEYFLDESSSVVLDVGLELVAEIVDGGGDFVSVFYFFGWFNSYE